MNIGILGTGGVGQTLAAHLSSSGHSVMIGTRDVQATLSRSEGSPPFSVWLEQHPGVRLGTMAEAAAFGDVVMNALVGHATLSALEAISEAPLSGKILIDVSNPLDFSKGMPPTLFVANTDSLAEQIQRLLPSVKVVKTLNTVTASLMVNPAQLGGGDHTLFVSGNDPAARAAVSGYLKEWFGWQHVIELGDISTARGTEMVMALWIRLWGALGTPIMNYKIVR